MKPRTARRIAVLMLAGGLTGGMLGGQAPAASLPAIVADAGRMVIAEGAVSRAPALTLIQWEGGVLLMVDGFAFSDATTWTWQGRDLGGALDGALDEGTARVLGTPTGFDVVWSDPPAHLRLSEAGRLEVQAAGLGVVASADAPARCPVW